MSILKKAWLCAAICALAGALAFSPVLKARFVWDDEIVQFHQLPALTSVVDAIKPPPGLPQWSPFFFRPVVMLSYMAEFRLTNAWLGNPHDPNRAALPHATTLLIHALCAAAVFFLARRLLKGHDDTGLGALAAGLVFALHPVHSESVCAIAGRSDSLATLFLLVSLLLALHGRDGKSLPALVGAGFLFLLAALSKEVALAGLALLPLCLWLTAYAPSEGGGKLKIPWGRVVAPFGVAAVVYALLRVWSGFQTVGAAKAGLGETAVRLLQAAAFYVGESFVPWMLSPYIPELPGALLTVAGLALAVSLAAVALHLYRRGVKLYLFCVLWFAVALAPSLVVVVNNTAQTLVAERYLYLPSVAFALAFGGATAALARTRFRAATLAVAGAVLVGYGSACLATTTMWQSDLALWTALSEKPSTARYPLPWQNLAAYHVKHGNLDEAERFFQRALAAEVPPEPGSVALISTGLGGVYSQRAVKASQQGNPVETVRLLKAAEGYYVKAMAGGTPDWTYPMNLGQSRLRRVTVSRALTGLVDRELLEMARNDFRTALRMSPGNQGVLQLLQTCNDIVLGR